MSTYPPQIRASYGLPGELVVDCFAGAGGASTGIESALGRPVDIAINHSAAAIAMHRANHPETKHYQEDIWAVDPREACGTRPVGLLWASPDCFPAGTMILTRDGYRAIETIRAGDEVLTHELRWRRVTLAMRTIKPLVWLRGHGHPGLLVSPEHPFLARRRRCRHVGWTLDPATWTTAESLDPGWYWGSPAEFPQAEPPEVPVYGRRTTTIDHDLLWLAGLYIAEGWTRLTKTRAEIVITCGHHETEPLRAFLSRRPRVGRRSGSGEMTWHERDTRTAHQFTMSHRGLVEWLRKHFGHGAGEKRIPGWALGMDADLRRALLDGYLYGDGHRVCGVGHPNVQAQTVSKALAFGIKALATTLGYSPTVYLNKTPNRVIEGRVVNSRPAWGVRWRDPIDPKHRQARREDGVEWAPIRQVVRCDPSQREVVYNLSVENDESYVADGIIVHNCTHHSRARGGKPRDHGIRSLAWVAVRWAQDVKPRTICVENVEEFAQWGPLDDAGQPIKERTGETFRQWVGALSDAGYRIDFRSLVAADYGTPTTRKRLFLVARRDGASIAWPEPTHGIGRPDAWHPAAEVIDWSLPCPSIFDRKRPLAEATLRRIAAGIRKYVLESAEPFIVPLTHQGVDRGRGIGEPLPTVTGAHRGEFALCSPTLITTGYGERAGQAPRVPGLEKPLGTVVGARKHALVAALLARHFGGVVGRQLGLPVPTVTAKDHHSLVEVSLLTKFYKTATGADVREPMPTVTAGAGGGHLAEVRAFLVGYYSNGGGQQQGLFDPLHTVTSKARFGLVTIAGVDYQIADIGMRMLQPHELFAAQGFPDDYEIAPHFNGKPMTKTAQIALCGNAVCPQVAEALVATNTRGVLAAAG